MNFKIHPRTILLNLVGSRAYGTFHQDSDYDFKGICIPPMETYLGNNSNFEQYEGKLTDHFPQKFHENHESTIYDIKKYFQLATANNPNILEIIFSEKEDVVIGDAIAVDLMNNRDMFLSKACRHSYAGYAYAQLKKIRSHRGWLMGEIPTMPTREQFGLPSQPVIDHAQLKAAMSMVNKQIETWTLHPEKEIPITVLNKARESIYDLIAWVLDSQDYNSKEFAEPIIVNAACYKLGFDANFSEYIVKQKQYNSALNHFNSYNEWKQNRNPKRAELEAKCGYDSKHAMHLVRLLRTAEELLSTGKLLVKRPDAAELIEIRNGNWTFEKLEEYSKTMDAKLSNLYNDPKCPLPYSADKQKIDAYLVKMIQDFNNEQSKRTEFISGNSKPSS